jgi:N-acyl-D-amino-acid deacylase
MDAHGGWIASAGDLARFAGAFSDPANCPLLKEETIETMWTPTPHNRTYNKNYSRGAGYGLGWWAGLRPDGRIDAEHGGIITGCCSSKLTKYGDGCTVAVLFNASDSALTHNGLHQQFHSELLSHTHHLGQLHLEPTAMPNE